MIDWYARADIQAALVAQLGENREAWVSAENYTSPRPRIVKSSSDLLQLIPRNRICSVCTSIESFKDPLLLGTQTAETLRIGWDFVLDIDSNEGLEAAKRCTKAVVKLLRIYDLKSLKIKFSGRRGFHLIIGGEAFDCFSNPKDFCKAYPIVPLQVAKFITAALSPADRKGVEIDTEIYAPRHLIRLAYSLHHITNLFGTPLPLSGNVDSVNDFTLESASPDRVEIDWDWLKLKPNLAEASTLLDYVAKWVQRSKQRRTGIRILSRAKTTGTRTYDSTPCIRAFMKEGFSVKLVGHRHSILCNVVNAIRRLGFDITPEQLDELNNRSEKPLPERELQYQIRYQLNRPRPYSFKCEIMQAAGLCPPAGCGLRRIQKGEEKI
jgi:hypothetical protein